MSYKTFILSAIFLAFGLSGCYTQLAVGDGERGESIQDDYYYYDDYADEDTSYAEEEAQYVENHYYFYDYPYPDYVVDYWDPWWTPRWGIYTGFYWGYPYWYPYNYYSAFYYPYYSYPWWYGNYYYGHYYSYGSSVNYGRRNFGRRSEHLANRIVNRDNSSGSRSGSIRNTPYLMRETRGSKASVAERQSRSERERIRAHRPNRGNDVSAKRSLRSTDRKTVSARSKPSYKSQRNSSKTYRSRTHRKSSPSYRSSSSRSSRGSFRRSSPRNSNRSSATKSRSSGSSKTSKRRK